MKIYTIIKNTTHHYFSIGTRVKVYNHNLNLGHQLAYLLDDSKSWIISKNDVLRIHQILEQL